MAAASSAPSLPHSELPPAENATSPTLASIPSGAVARATLSQIPEDTLLHILSYLNAPEVCRVSACSKELKAATDSSWRDLFLRSFDLLPSDLPLLALNAKEAFKRRLLFRQRKLRLAAERRVKAAERKKATGRQDSCRQALTVLNLVTWTFTPMPLLIALVSLIAVKLDGGTDSSWPAVFAPLFLWLGLLLLSLAPTTFLHVRDMRGTAPATGSDSIWADQLENLSWTPPGACFRHLIRRRRALIHATLLCCVLLLVPILLVYKFAAVQDSGLYAGGPWGAVLIPVWLATCLFVTAMCSKYEVSERSDFCMFLTMLCFLLLPFFIVMVLLAVSLDDGYSIPVHLILVPFWILNGLLVCGMASACCFGCVRAAWIGDVEELFVLLFTVVAACVVVLPPLVSLILVTLKIEGESDLPWINCLAPLLFLLAIATVGTWIGGLALCADKLIMPCVQKRREARRDPFDAADAV